MINKIFKILKHEVVFTISCIIAIITSFFNTPKLEYIDFKVIILLFNLILVVAAFQKLKVLDTIAVSILSRFKSKRTVFYVLIFITFVAAMLITNDVALITLVPLTIIIAARSKFDPIYIIIFQTLAANIGSSLTPIGNPQNLFIYSTYQPDSALFLYTGLIITLIGAVWLFLVNMRTSKENLSFELSSVKLDDKKKIAIFSALFLITILSVFKIIDYRVVFIITFLSAIFVDIKLFKDIDYFLLVTFAAFFIIVGNISSMEFVRSLMNSVLGSKYNVYFSSIVFSQFISNVPSAVLLSGFTDMWRPLMLGVDVGGMGTLIASLASVISYKFYIKSYDNSSSYLKKFHLYNFVSLGVILVLVAIFL